LTVELGVAERLNFFTLPSKMMSLRCLCHQSGATEVKCHVEQRPNSRTLVLALHGILLYLPHVGEASCCSAVDRIGSEDIEVRSSKGFRSCGVLRGLDRHLSFEQLRLHNARQNQMKVKQTPLSWPRCRSSTRESVKIMS